VIAGELEIRIAAVYDQLNRDLAAAQTASARAGQQSGQQFGQQFDTASSSYMQRAADQLKTKFAKSLSGMNIAMNLANGLEASIKSGSGEDAWRSALRSIPFGGLAEAIGDSIVEAVTGQKAEQAAQEAARIAENARTEARNRLKRLEIERVQTVQQAEIDAAAETDKRKAAIEKARLDIYNARNATNQRLVDALDKQERTKIEEIQKLREQAIKDRLQRELRAIDEMEAKERKAQEEREKKEREAAERQEAERRKREIDRIDSEMKQRIDALREQQVAVQSSVSSVQTAHGTFRYSSYTDAEKKQIDRSILEEIKTISATAAAMRNAVNAGGGFN